MHTAPGDPIYRIGHVPEPVAILSGIARVFTRIPTGRQVTVRYAKRGELIGLVSRLSGSHSLEARAVTKVSAAVLPLEHIETLGHRQPEILWEILRDTAMWTAASIRRVAGAAAGPMTARVARHLVDLAVYESEGQAVAQVTHQGLADVVGTSREVVTRTTATLRTLGLVQTHRGNIVLTDPEGLVRVAAGVRPHPA